MIHERVKHARQYHGWSQTQLAEMIGVSQPAISQIERTGQISEETLAGIANVSGFAPWWFQQGPLPDLPMGSLRFRKRATATLRDDERLRATVRQAVEVLNQLSPAFELPPVRIGQVQRDFDGSDDAIEMLALEVREWLGLGQLDPVPSIVRSIERSGGIVIGTALPIDKHDAVSFWAAETGRPVICFSRGFSGDHQRLSVSHELGHIVLHQTRSDIEPKQAEDEAFRFAAALLLPATVALEEIEAPVTLRSLAYVKAKWGLSISALIRRCLDLRIITAERRLSLEKQLSARGWRKEEPVYVPDEQPVIMTKLIEGVVRKSTPGRLHSELGLPPMACRDLMM
jgi:Zn-dependent peptidase ImmA (M78 family)/DNA-binding XRE family transcriptional regulator